jgi:hypothetical protein
VIQFHANRQSDGLHVCLDETVPPEGTDPYTVPLDLKVIGIVRRHHTNELCFTATMADGVPIGGHLEEANAVLAIVNYHLYRTTAQRMTPALKKK